MDMVCIASALGTGPWAIALALELDRGCRAIVFETGHLVAFPAAKITYIIDLHGRYSAFG